MQAVTGVVLTLNSETWLKENLESLSFCHELMVVDSGSTDSTLDIATDFGAALFHKDWDGPIPQWGFAFSKVKTPWVVSLDSDEFLTSVLIKSICQALTAPAPYIGFWCNRSSWYMDRFMRYSGWYPDRLLRVFKPEDITIEGYGPHQVITPKGQTARLQGDIIHHPYADMTDHMARINRYTTEAAQIFFEEGKTANALTALSHGVGKFLKQYFLKRGFLDGTPGLFLALNGAFYTYLKYAKLVEKIKKKE